MMVELVDIFSDLEGMGVYEIALPFLLVFTVVFGALRKANIFGNAKFDGVIGLVVAFLIIREDIFISFMNDLLARFSVIIVVIVAFLIIFGIFGAGTGTFTKGLMTIFIIAALIGGVYVLFDMMEEHGLAEDTSIGDWWDDNQNVVLIGVFGVIIIWLLFSGLGGGGQGTGAARAINDAWGVGTGRSGNEGGG